MSYGTINGHEVFNSFSGVWREAGRICGSREIHHFFCEIPAVTKLSCSDTSVNESVLHVSSATVGLSGRHSSQFSQRTFDLLVPQAVDEGIQHGGNHSIHDGGYCAYLLMKLACSDTRVNQLASLGTLFLFVAPCILIVVSYVRITMAVFQIPSAKGRHKAFSTCSSHLSVVILFYG